MQLPGTKFVIPKDDIAKKIIQFLEEIKFYLVMKP
jgi:hypothetical protein